MLCGKVGVRLSLYSPQAENQKASVRDSRSNRCEGPQTSGGHIIVQTSDGHIIVQTSVATSLYRHQVATSLNRHQWPHHCTHIRWPHHNSLVFSSQSALHKGTCQHETHTRTHIQSLTSLNMHSFATEEILAARVQSPKLAHRQVPS